MIACYPTEVPSITARVALHVDTARNREPVGEDIGLDVRGAARAWVPSTLPRLRAADLPVCSGGWGTPRRRHPLRPARRRRRRGDDPLGRHGPPRPRQVRRWSSRPRVPRPGDLNWTRLQSWQDFTARFFDDPAARARLPTSTSSRWSSRPGPAWRSDPLRRRLRFCRWVAKAARVDGPVPRGSRTRPDRRRGRWNSPTPRVPVRVRFVRPIGEGCTPGRSTGWSSGPRAPRWRSPRPRTTRWYCAGGRLRRTAGALQCVRIGAPEESKMLARYSIPPHATRSLRSSLAAAAGWWLRLHRA